MPVSDSIKLKPGALSVSDQEFIRENALNMSVSDIAKALSRREGPVIRYIKENGLASRDEIPDFNDEYEEILLKLRKSIFYNELKLQLEEDELKYFQSHWIDFILQFKGDVLPSEGMQIRELIIADILVNRIMRKRLMAKKDIERYSKLLADEYQLPPDQRSQDDLVMWTSEIEQARAAEASLNNEQNKLQQDKKSLYKDLKATRDQRFSKVESGEKTFMTIIKQMYEEREREKEGTLAELVRLSTEKQRQKLTEWHQYGDGQLDMPLLNAESILKKKEEQDNEEIQIRQDKENEDKLISS